MQADKTTINDLSIFSNEEELSILHLLNFTKSVGGREWLRIFLNRPLHNIQSITETQQLLQRIITVLPQWPQTISNGTIMVLERFYDTPIGQLPKNPNTATSLLYKIFNAPDFSLTRYSVTHGVDFVKGMQQFANLLQAENNPAPLKAITERISLLLAKTEVQQMINIPKGKRLSNIEILNFGYYLRLQFKQEAFELIEIYSKLDAYFSMATACDQFHFSFPQFIESADPSLAAQQLYHPLLPTPVAYNITLDPQQNFLFLTGANMAGKSTFIKAIGVSVYLAHIGMGVPAQSMKLSLFDGLLSNIQVADNIVQGESYFFNEVQRIRKTIEKISDGKKWLILIDELFKGTNVQDAMKCSTTVIEGLRKMHNALFILSTHLYEIGEALKQYSNIQFRYFETEVKEDQLLFSYHLKEGISNDRLGYLILKREGVVDMLNKL